MCWTTYREELATPRTADKDIKVFKVCRPTNDPNCAKPYYFYSYCDYKIGETYSIHTDIFVRSVVPISPPYTCYDIDRGFHSYNLEKMNINVEGENIKYVRIRNNENIQVDSMMTMRGLVKVNCTIPKGATYYENENGELVSDTIRIDRFTPIG